MPTPVTWGLVLVLLAAAALLWAGANLLRWNRQRSFGRGTPQYADGRLARRAALYGLAIAVALGAVGWLTPLCRMPIA